MILPESFRTMEWPFLRMYASIYVLVYSGIYFLLFLTPIKSWAGDIMHALMSNASYEERLSHYVVVDVFLSGLSFPVYTTLGCLNFCKAKSSYQYLPVIKIGEMKHPFLFHTLHWCSSFHVQVGAYTALIDLKTRKINC